MVEDGSCASVLLLIDNTAWIASVGDSKVSENGLKEGRIDQMKEETNKRTNEGWMDESKESDRHNTTALVSLFVTGKLIC